jgi:hypothetical protein
MFLADVRTRINMHGLGRVKERSVHAPKTIGYRLLMHIGRCLMRKRQFKVRNAERPVVHTRSMHYRRSGTTSLGIFRHVLGMTIVTWFATRSSIVEPLVCGIIHIMQMCRDRYWNTRCVLRVCRTQRKTGVCVQPLRAAYPLSMVILGLLALRRQKRRTLLGPLEIPQIRLIRQQRSFAIDFIRKRRSALLWTMGSTGCWARRWWNSKGQSMRRWKLRGGKGALGCVPRMLRICKTHAGRSRICHICHSGSSVDCESIGLNYSTIRNTITQGTLAQSTRLFQMLRSFFFGAGGLLFSNDSH